MIIANEDPLLRLPQVAAMLGVAPRTLYDLRRRGILPEPIALSPKLKGYRRSTIEAVLASREVRA